MTINKKLILTLCIFVSFGLNSVLADGEKHSVEPPNGGRMIKTLDPQAEIYIAEDGLVQVTLVNEEGEVVPASDEIVSLVGGDRMDPITLSFAKKGDVFVSEGKLPLEKSIPLVVQVQASPSSEIVRERFNLNMGECPTCEYKEYACRCHDEEPKDSHGHDHDHDH